MNGQINTSNKLMKILLKNIVAQSPRICHGRRPRIITII